MQQFGGDHMRHHRSVIRSLSILSASVIIVSLFSGCSKTTDPAETPADAVWYDSERIVLADLSDALSYSSRNGDITEGLIYTDGNSFLIEEDLGYKDGTDIHKLERYDSSGNLLMSLDLDKDIDYSEIKSGSEDPIEYFYVNDSVVYCLSDIGNSFYLSSFDEGKGSFCNWTEITGLKGYITPDEVIIRSCAYDGNVLLYVVGDYGDIGYRNLKLIKIDSDLKCSMQDLTDIMTGNGISSLIYVKDYSGSKAVIIGYDTTGTVINLDVDLDNASAVSIKTDERLDSLLASNGRLLCSDRYGIREFDIKNGSFKTVMGFDKCNINRLEASEMVPVYADDNTVILYGLICRNNYETKIIICKLTASDTDPTEGKDILKLVDLSEGGLDYTTAEAIRLFNDTSKDSYIILDDRYDQDLSVSGDAYDYMSPEYTIGTEQADAELENKIKIDMMNGEGPDIIINGYSYPELYSGDCLVDLKPYYEGDAGLEKGSYFDNILLTGNRQIITSAIFEGIVYDSQRTGKLPSAPTYEEYTEFVKGPCNGTDQILFSKNERLRCFLLLFDNIYPLITDANGIPNLDSKEFRALCEYVKTLPEDSSTMAYDPDSVARLGCLPWNDPYGGFDSIMGLPSLQGTCQRLSCQGSVGISSSCEKPDEAWRFVKILLSDDIQKYMGLDGTWSVNREILRSSLHKGISETNSELESMGFFSDGSSGMHPIDEGIADIYVEMMDTALPCVEVDPDINIVLLEEIQSYLAGDRSLDDVIPVMDNRIRTIVSEKMT